MAACCELGGQPLCLLVRRRWQEQRRSREHMQKANQFVFVENCLVRARSSSQHALTVFCSQLSSEDTPQEPPHTLHSRSPPTDLRPCALGSQRRLLSPRAAPQRRLRSPTQVAAPPAEPRTSITERRLPNPPRTRIATALSDRCTAAAASPDGRTTSGTLLFSHSASARPGTAHTRTGRVC